jgi:hypothetical protein
MKDGASPWRTKQLRAAVDAFARRRRPEKKTKSLDRESSVQWSADGSGSLGTAAHAQFMVDTRIFFALAGPRIKSAEASEGHGCGRFPMGDLSAPARGKRLADLKPVRDLYALLARLGGADCRER